LFHSRIIAIDGPSASGKGTLARSLADILGYAYLDTGAVYRLVAKAILDQGGNPGLPTDSVDAALRVQNSFDLSQLQDPALRTDEVAVATSKASAHPEVRALLMDIQRNFATHPPEPARGAVLDGRDIGTVVCPDALVKLFVTARPEIRAERRFKELQLKGFATTYEAVLQDMRERDARDSGRTTAPLKPAENAILFDTSDLTADKALEKALHLVRQFPV
jgi:cytidylate kinase